MDKDRSLLKEDRITHTEYMQRHNLKSGEFQNYMIPVPLPGIRNAIKRFRRRSWVKDGYLDDAEWLLNHGGGHVRDVAMANLNRNGWGQGERMQKKTCAECGLLLYARSVK